MAKETKKVGGPLKEPAQTPKGMRDLVGDELFAYQGFFEKAAEVALYYGFKPIETPIVEDAGIYLSGTGVGTDVVDKQMYTLKTKGEDLYALRPEGTPGVMRSYLQQGMQSWPQPVQLYYFGPFFRHDKPQRGRYRQLYQFGIEILGTDKSIADATIIRLTTLILEEAGLKNLKLEINSIGDKECRPAYRKELVNYYKKHVSEVCVDCKDRLKINPLRILDCKEEKCQTLKAGAPSSVSFLCSSCKHHFKEVLEYLETMGIEYSINNNLVRGLDYYTRTVFEIQLPSKQNADGSEGLSLTVAGGGRYDYLAKMLGSKKDVPGMGVGIGADRVLMEEHEALAPRIVKKPKMYFIQLGFDAKLKSLLVTEILRKCRIPVSHSLSKDSLGVQLGMAEKLGVPYALILGQREVFDNTIIVRNMANRSQEIIKIDKLAEYLKKIKF